MYILAIETTGPVGSVALIRDDNAGDVPMKITTTEMSHLRNLAPMTTDLMNESGVTGSDVAAVSVSVGPGSFTGIRIGVSTGRALAQAWDVPCIAVPTLCEFKEKVSGSDRQVLAILNARRGQVYGAVFGLDTEGIAKVSEQSIEDSNSVKNDVNEASEWSGKIETIMEPGPYMLDDMLDRIDELGIKPKVYGDGIDAYKEAAGLGERLSALEFAEDGIERYQTADMTARYAVAKCKAGETVGYEELMPNYMRESEAEQRLKDGTLERMRKAKLEKMMRGGN